MKTDVVSFGKGWTAFLKAGDVLENLTDAANPLVFRSPKCSWVVRDKHWNITGTITPPFRDDHRPLRLLRGIRP